MMTLELEVTAAKLTGDPARDIKSLSNHVFMLEEKLRYTLRNLDVTNFNDLGLARYENGRLQIYTKEITAQTDKLRVEFGKETDEIHALISATADELLAEIEDVEGNYTTLKATVNGLTTRVGNVEGNYSSLTQTVNGIQSTVSSHTTSINNQAATNTSLQSQITQTANKISAVVSAVDDSSGNVTAASIVAAINDAGSTVKISADHVELAGDLVTITDLKTGGSVVIDAGNLSAGTINGAEFYSEGPSISGDPLAGYSVLLASGGRLEFGQRGWGDNYPQYLSSMYILGGYLRIYTPDYGLLINVNGNNWEFNEYGIAFNGNYVFEAP